MDKYRPTDPIQLADKETMFRQTMRNVFTVFGEHSARLYAVPEDLMRLENCATVDGHWEKKFSVSAFDIQASALLNQPYAKVQAAAEQIREAYLSYFLAEPSVRLAISRQPAGANATKTRWFGFKMEVQRILDDTIIEPRFFSYDYRRQLYNENPSCRICGNQIHTFDDSTVDHIHPHSKGGKTVPANAQLAHRICNARKCAKVSDQPDLSPQHSTADRNANRSNRKDVRTVRPPVPLHDLITAGFVKPPLVIQKVFKGHKLVAQVDHGGRVNWNGTI